MIAGTGYGKARTSIFPDLDMYFVVDLRRPGGGKGRIGCRSMSKKTGKTIVMGTTRAGLRYSRMASCSRDMRPGCVNVKHVGSTSLQT